MQIALLSDYLKRALDVNASQIFFTVGTPVMYKDIHNNMVNLMPDKTEDARKLLPEHTKALVDQAIKNEQDREILMNTGEVEATLSSAGKMRCRINAFMQRGTYAMTVTIINSKGDNVLQLEHWKSIRNIDLDKITELPKGGLIMLVGTNDIHTFASSIINYHNQNNKIHIMTLEDNIDTLHRHQQSIVNQREFKSDIANMRVSVLKLRNLGVDLCLISS